jgi:hypothetical protein
MLSCVLLECLKHDDSQVFCVTRESLIKFSGNLSLWDVAEFFCIALNFMSGQELVPLGCYRLNFD